MNLPALRPPRPEHPIRLPPTPRAGGRVGAARRLRLCGAAGLLLTATALRAQDGATPLPAPAAVLAGLVKDAALTLWGDSRPAPRVEVVVGALDPRLKLAPCQRVEPYLPANIRPLGSTRVGLRCREGRTLWNVYLPVTVKLWAPALVARGTLPAGTVLEAEHLVSAEVDQAASPDPVLRDAKALLGRTLVRGLGAGDPLHLGDLKARQWFGIGESVRIVAQGPGYSIQAEGVAMSAGIEGLPVRVRTEGGQVVTGSAVGGRDVVVGL